MNKPGAQGLIQLLIICKLQQLLLQSFACLDVKCLDVVDEFKDVALVLAYIRDMF